jgi:TatD DNase family protein
MYFFDSHTHMNDAKFAADREAALQRALTEHNVRYLLNVGFDRKTIRETLQLAETHDFIYAAIGWHPVEAIDCTVDDLDWIRSLTTHEKVVALGEMGLDYHWDRSPKKVQADVFRQQIRLAREVKLPIVIHNREADADVLCILQEEHAEEVGGVMHCFAGDVAMMEQCLALDFMIGIGGPVTFKNAKLPKQIATQVPVDRLLIETDAPYLAPHPFRGKRNETGYVQLIAEQIAALREMSVAELATITTQNAKRLFRIGEDGGKEVS